MPTLTIPDMSCNHCVQAITRAIQAQDANAQVSIDLEQRRVTVTGTRLDAPALHAIIAEEGYSPETVA